MQKEFSGDKERKIPVEVYAEVTPNPESMKFVTSRILLQDETVEYASVEEAVNCPLAIQLFNFSGVKKVFITSNFITITKDPGLDWFDITNILREFIRGFLMSGEPVFIIFPDSKPSPEKTITTQPSSPEAEEKIKQLLDEYVRPAVEGDGGAIHFKSFENGIVNVVLKGACSGCPSSTVTLKAGIENLLKQMMPEVQEVVAIEE
jgi:Fe-S cluster biogenesis protein NfuA